MLRRHFLTLPAGILFSLKSVRNLFSAETSVSESGTETVAAHEAVSPAVSAVPVDPKKIVFLADLHIGPDVPKHAENLKNIITEILAMNPRPAKIFILGDLVSTYGKSEEYQELKGLMAPLDAAGIPWFLVVGNHDTRERMFEVFPEKKLEVSEIPGKQVGIVESDCLDFVILDSRMDDTNAYMAEKEKFPQRRPWDGTMEPESVAWLEKTLPNRKKPVFILAHHPIQQTRLTELLAKYPSVQGYLFGHNHQYLRKNTDGVETFAFPTTSERILTKAEPSGYMVMEILPERYDFTLKTLGGTHPLDGHLESIPAK